MQPLGVGGVDERDFGVKNCYESSGRDWSARSAPIGGEKVCQKKESSILILLGGKIMVLYAPYFSSINVYTANDLVLWRQLSQSPYSSFQS
ncbi:hypothetical protein TNCV_2678181 [Trichonephila clavipes]|nr:hypothetical protein TNCV_2678181 [Trichonephila clavipes]